MSSYSTYKPINLPWLSSVPAHWDMVRNKVVLKESKTTVGGESSKFTLLSLTKGGVIIRDLTQMKGKFPSDFGTYKTVDNGQIIFCLFDIDETPRTVGLSKHQGMITGAYDVFTLNDVNPRFFEYYYLSLDYVKAMRPLYTGLRKVIGINTFMQTHFPRPPRAEQDQIVRYLDWKMSQINKLIKAKKKQNALLQELKRTFINHTLSKSSDTWHNYRAKYLFRERNERSEHGDETHLSMSQKYGLVSDELLDERRMLSESYAGGKICYENDVVLNRLKAHLGVFALARQKGVISPDYTVLQPITTIILPKYAEYYLKSDVCRHELRIRVRGVVEGFWRLYTEDFNTITMPIPTLDEQRKILHLLDGESERIEKLASKLNNEVDLLHEYRTRLISDVVTGKLDVRGVVIPDYEAVEETAVVEDDLDDNLKEAGED